MWISVKLSHRFLKETPDLILKVEVQCPVTIGQIGRLFWPNVGIAVACAFVRKHDSDVDDYISVQNPENFVLKDKDRVAYEFVQSTGESVIDPPSEFVVIASPKGPVLNVSKMQEEDEVSDVAPSPSSAAAGRRRLSASTSTTLPASPEESDSDVEIIEGKCVIEPVPPTPSAPVVLHTSEANLAILSPEKQVPTPSSSTPSSSSGSAVKQLKSILRRSGRETPSRPTSRDSSAGPPTLENESSTPRSCSQTGSTTGRASRKRTLSSSSRAGSESRMQFPRTPTYVDRMRVNGPRHPELAKFHEKTWDFRRRVISVCEHNHANVAEEILSFFPNFKFQPSLLKFDFDRHTSRLKKRQIDFVHEWDTSYAPKTNSLFAASAIPLSEVTGFVTSRVHDPNALLTFNKFLALLRLHGGGLSPAVFKDIVVEVTGMSNERALRHVRSELRIRHPVIMVNERGFWLCVNRHQFSSYGSFATVLAQFIQAHFVFKCAREESYTPVLQALGAMHGLTLGTHPRKALREFLTAFLPWI